MSRWLLKAATQRAIGFLPRSHVWNLQFQTHVTRSMELTPARLSGGLGHCARHLSAYASHSSGREQTPATALEIGTGWYPIVALGLYLCGAEKVLTYDIVPLLNADRVRETMRRLVDAADEGSLRGVLPSYDPERLNSLRPIANGDVESARDLLGGLGVAYVVGDASCTALDAESVDLVFSNVTFAHVPYLALGTMLRELRRIISSQGVMSHEIDLADQFAAFDDSITKFNFLKFSDRTWRLIDESADPTQPLTDY